MISFDTNLLVNIYQLKAGVPLSGATSSGTGAPAAKLPTPPWDPKSNVPRADELTKRALLGASFVNVGGAQLDVQGASDDYKKLFALYQGLNTLYGLAGKSQESGTTAGDLTRIQTAFARGLSEVSAFTDTLTLDKARIARGEVADKLVGDSGVPREKDEYVTGAIHTGASTDVVTAFQGAVNFDIAVKRGPANIAVNIDLAGMNATPRTMANVVSFINTQLQAAGVFSRFQTQKLPNAPRTVMVSGKPVTLPALADSWALKIKGDSSEKLTFSTSSTAGAVYLGQSVGKTPSVVDLKAGKVDETQRQLLKFQTDTTAVAAPEQQPGEANWTAGRVFSDAMGKEVSVIRASAAAPDGSVYVLGDVTGTTNKQSIQGTTDVALMKYDSAGKLLYTRTLGAADSASGFALAVSADGSVAVAGSVKGNIEGVVEGPLNSSDASGKTDSFVTLYNSLGEEQWTERRGAKENDEAKAVAFNADGAVFVAGRTKSAMPGAGASGGWDNYVTAYATQSTGKPKALFTTQYGTSSDDKVSGLAVNGSQVVIAGVESGSAVLRSFDISTTTTNTNKTTSGGVLTTTITTAVDGTPTSSTSSSFTTGAADSTSSVTYVTAAAATAGAVRNLGAIGGGDIAGIAFNGTDIIVAGTTTNGALNAGTVTTGYGSGQDAFVAKLSSSLTAQASDRLTYYGGDFDDSATAVAVAGGKVWITGSSSSTTLGGAARIGTKDGYAASIDPNTGAVGWSTRYTAKDGVVAPTSIAVNVTGSSALDKLGLPTGTLLYKDSQLITSATSLRAGDQFFIRSREGAQPTAVTIDAKDTLTTLATKVRRAAGFTATVAVVKSGDYSKLQIKPLNANSTVEVISGKAGKDALSALGLPEGVARTTGGAADTAKKIYGLKLSNDLSLTTKDAGKAAVEQLAAALAKITSIYRDFKIAAQPKTTGAADTSGPVPAYLQAQLANYQAGLNRLTGGG